MVSLPRSALRRVGATPCLAAGAIVMTLVALGITGSGLVSAVDALTADCFWDVCGPSLDERLISAAISGALAFFGVAVGALALLLWRATFVSLRRPSEGHETLAASSSPEEHPREG